MHRIIVDRSQIIEGASLESLVVNRDLEIAGELVRLAFVIFGRHQKISFISIS